MQAATTPVFDGKHEELDPSTDEAFLVFSSLAERCTRHPREVVETFILHTENKANHKYDSKELGNTSWRAIHGVTRSSAPPGLENNMASCEFTFYSAPES